MDTPRTPYGWFMDTPRTSHELPMNSPWTQLIHTTGTHTTGIPNSMDAPWFKLVALGALADCP